VITDHVTRSLAPRKCLGELACDPFCGGACRDADPDKASAIEPDDDEGVQQVEANGRDNNRSIAAISAAWLYRKVRNPWLGGPRRFTMYFATLDCATGKPSLSNSP
jgi:hypothetical protein